MKREHTTFLKNWLTTKDRKPLVIRGARQVGKTWLIRNLAEIAQKQLIELNFEKQPELASLFSSNDPKEILINISASFNQKIDPLKTLLFLDEIQAAPELLSKLRWFAEDMAELPVIAAGSLLDFTLEEHEFSMPVGRIGYLYLEPLSFEEFLEASSQEGLRSYLENYTLPTVIPASIHLQLLKLLKEYLIIGGMPAAVSSWVKKNQLDAVHQIQVDLLTTYRDDFAKYSGRLTIRYLQDIMSSIPRQLGRKFVYREVNSETTIPPLKQALNLLCKARICHRIIATAANGLPLDAEANEKFIKMILLDCGLCSASLGLSLHQLTSTQDITLINSGAMAEQLVGQLLRTISPPYVSPLLYYWQREKKGAGAEIDYVIQHENQVIPIEVKAGTTGSLKSLHQFMKEKKGSVAVRVNSDLPSIGKVEVKDAQGELIDYKLLSIPFYLVRQLHRLIEKFKTSLH
jgi:predicted AAA+ superfamily ATPase